MGVEDYKEALKIGQKAYRKALGEGRYPYLSVLDDILSMQKIEAEVPLGLVEIPMSHIAGTRTAGRTKAFANNFMPLLEDGSEFSSKWIALCDSLIEEGLREPVKAYEFLNRFYILEGNKRVSVTKYLGAVTIPAYVTRLLPHKNDSDENRLYYEFVDFYSHSKINYLDFSKPGSYRRLQLTVGKEPEEEWTEEERREFRAFFTRFKDAYEEKAGGRAPIGSSDAMLIYLKIYPYEGARKHLPKDFKINVAKSWDEFTAGGEEGGLAVSMQPVLKEKSSVISKILPDAPLVSKIRKVAFINEKNAQSSSWTYGHELGRQYVQEQLQGKIQTEAYFDVDVTDYNKCMDVIERAIQDGCEVIFTTTPKMLNESLQAAVNHPEVKILNCSLGSEHPSLRSYYGRMHEAKFITGVIAGALSESDEIGYVADYPIYGMTANINAFALGAKMVNPRAKVILEWSTVPGRDIYANMLGSGVCFVSDRDMIAPEKDSREFGLYYVDRSHDDLKPVNMAVPVWNWGKFYELILRSITGGTWKKEETPGVKALNYWWGMKAGVVDVTGLENLPEGTARLVRLLKEDICAEHFHIFTGILRDQDGNIRHEGDESMKPEEILTMNWLADNVIGEIPQPETLTEEAKQVVAVQGVNKSEEDAVV